MKEIPCSAESEEGWLCAGSVLPIWQPLFDVLARSSSNSVTFDGKKAWPHLSHGTLLARCAARMLAAWAICCMMDRNFLALCS